LNQISFRDTGLWHEDHSGGSSFHIINNSALCFYDLIPGIITNKNVISLHTVIGYISFSLFFVHRSHSFLFFDHVWYDGSCNIWGWCETI